MNPRVLFFLFSVAVLIPSAAMLRAAGDQPAARPAPAVAGTPEFTLASRDGLRHYAVHIARPTQPPPAAGYPVLYLLDGHSTFAALTPELRERTWAQMPVVFVAISRSAPSRGALNAARMLDFTVGPRSLQGGVADEASGGADAFIELLADEIRPRVGKAVPIDAARQAIYGHSFGAICVLRTLFTRLDLFQTYIAASPSLWWGDGYLARALVEAEPTLRAASARVLLTIGDAEARARGAGADSPEAMQNVVTLESMARSLDGYASIDATSRVFEGRNHGSALPPSIDEALALITRK